MKIRSTILWVVAIAILGLVNYGVFQKEQLKTTGQVVYLKLAPVDPRSLIQGDYMRLDYAVLRDLNLDSLPDKGQLLIDLDAEKIATQAQVYDGTAPITSAQLLLNFRKDGWRLKIGADNFFFQEGEADIFAEAEYAELRIGSDGDVVLVGLLGDGLAPLINP